MVAAGAHPYSRVGTLGRVPMSLTVRVEGRWAWSGRTVSYRAVLELRCVPLRAPVPYQTKKAFYRKFSRFSDRQVARAIAEGECRVRCPVECRALCIAVRIAVEGYTALYCCIALRAVGTGRVRCIAQYSSFPNVPQLQNLG